MARLLRTTAATGLLLLAAACGLEQSLLNPTLPALPERVAVDIQVENHSADEWSLLYFEAPKACHWKSPRLKAS